MLNLIEHKGKLKSHVEIPNPDFKVYDLDSNPELLEEIKESINRNFNQDDCKKLVKALADKVLSFKNYNAYIRENYIVGRGSHSTEPKNASYYQYYARIDTPLSKKFNWNEDAEYCERQYDGFEVIEEDTCPLFDEWLAYARQLEKEAKEKYGVVVDIELEGFKYEITLDIEVKGSLIC